MRICMPKGGNYDGIGAGDLKDHTVALELQMDM
jgi:hypothetical protein